jgi:DNA/RNA-binding domain of Phe-tRNA-synthetase-like protein
MTDDLSVSIDPKLKQLLPGLQAHVVRFAGARIGLAHHGLDPLRQRVFQRLRTALQDCRSLDDIPEVGSFIELLTALGRDPISDPPIHATLIKCIAERKPFPVINDAVDGANLTGLYYLLPVFLADCRMLHPPLSLAPAWEHRELVTIDGTHPALGEPFLMDSRGPIVGIQSQQVRGTVNQGTAEFLVVMLDPGLEGGVDHDTMIRRLENWMQTLTGVHKVGSLLSR